MDGGIFSSPGRVGFLTNLRCLLATDPASRAAGRERCLFLSLDDFVQWLAAAERQPAEVRKAIDEMPSGMREDACVVAAPTKPGSAGG